MFGIDCAVSRGRRPIEESNRRPISTEMVGGPVARLQNSFHHENFKPYIVSHVLPRNGDCPPFETSKVLDCNPHSDNSSMGARGEWTRNFHAKNGYREVTTTASQQRNTLTCIQYTYYIILLYNNSIIMYKYGIYIHI